MPGLPKHSVAVVLGTRPEIVKLSGIARLLGDAALIVHTGQHYDRSLSEVFFDQLELPSPDVHIGIGGETRGQQIGIAVSALDELLGQRRPSVVVAQGDTNTVLAAAVAANAAEIPMAHVEAGLRSFDRRMPEEHNRVVTDHLADLLLAPTETAAQNLIAERIEPDRITVTGNTIVEAVTALMPQPAERQAIVHAHGVRPGEFVLSTIHRPENVDHPGTFAAVLGALAEIPAPVVIPLHPRSIDRARRFGLGSLLERLIVVEPIGYREFLGLGAEAALLVSDSGGVQEEVSVYKRPVIVVRRSTERPEVIGTFAERVLPGPEIAELAAKWLAGIEELHARLAVIPTPYGDGSASARSVAAIERLIDHG